MDRIKITIEQANGDDGAIFIRFKINDNDLPGILNIVAFFAIKQENELVPLFTYGCGDFGCGGYYVNVSRNFAKASYWFRSSGETYYAEKDRLCDDSS